MRISLQAQLSHPVIADGHAADRRVTRAHTWLSTLQAARFYVPALGAISLLGAWLLVRVPRRQPLVAITTLVVVAALFGLGGWAFDDMYHFPFGPQRVVVPGHGGTVELKPGPGVKIGGPASVAPGGPGRAVRIRPSSGPTPAHLADDTLSGRHVKQSGGMDLG